MTPKFKIREKVRVVSDSSPLPVDRITFPHGRLIGATGVITRIEHYDGTYRYSILSDNYTHEGTLYIPEQDLAPGYERLPLFVEVEQGPSAG